MFRSWHFSYHLYVCLRWTYQEFFSRYRVLMKQKDVLPDKKLTCKNVLEKLVQVSQTISVFSIPITIKNEGYIMVSFVYLWHLLFEWISVFFASVFPLSPSHSYPSNHWSLPPLSFRTRINTSLVRPRSSSGPARLPTWRSWERTSCALLAFASRKPSAAGWHARSICASAALPSPSRGSPEDTRLAGESTSLQPFKQNNHMWLLLADWVCFIRQCCVKQFSLSTFAVK